VYNHKGQSKIRRATKRQPRRLHSTPPTLSFRRTFCARLLQCVDLRLYVTDISCRQQLPENEYEQQSRRRPTGNVFELRDEQRIRCSYFMQMYFSRAGRLENELTALPDVSTALVRLITMLFALASSTR